MPISTKLEKGLSQNRKLGDKYLTRLQNRVVLAERGAPSYVSEYDEEDARKRPAEDGLEARILEDENLRVSSIQNFEDELEDFTPDRGNSDEIVEGVSELSENQ